MECVRVYNGEKDCPGCGWTVPKPDLAAAVLGGFSCSECGFYMGIMHKDRREILNNIEQRLHLLDNQ